VAHIRQSRPDYGRGFQVNVLKTFEVVPAPHSPGANSTRRPPVSWEIGPSEIFRAHCNPFRIPAESSPEIYIWEMSPYGNVHFLTLGTFLFCSPGSRTLTLGTFLESSEAGGGRVASVSLSGEVDRGLCLQSTRGCVTTRWTTGLSP